MKPTLLAAFVAAFFVQQADAFQAVETQTKRPNVVYIIIDELGYYEPAFMGGVTIQTPSFDRMASEGIRMNNLLAGAPVCAPTRCSLLTGKHSGHTSVRANGGGTPLRADEITIASMLKEQGYATGGFGKWGCGGRDSTGVPEKHGFDTFLGYYDQVHAHTFYPPYLIRNSEEVVLEGNHGGSTGKTYSQYVIHEAAKSFIREHSQSPFFAYLPYTPPHGLFDIPDTDPAWAIYKDKPWPEPARRYAAMATMVDRQVGEIFQLLKELGIDHNTLVFFSGDNGGNDYFASAEFPRGVHQANKNPKTGVEYRGTKGTLYEGGLRIPFVARWPGKIAAGKVSDHLGYFPDIMPTIAEATNAKLPQDVDGISIFPELIGEAATGRKQAVHDYLYWEHEGWTAIRQGQWRAVKPPKLKDWTLYDLATDPSESIDIASANPAILEKLVALAKGAHQPAVEGTFTRLDRHQRDRRAKLGKHETRPNVVLIMADDQGWGDTGYNGHPELKTPNLDEMATSGLRLNRFYTAHFNCSPTRGSVMTGRHPFRYGTFNPGAPIRAQELTVAKVLQSAGYATGHFGKWHLNGKNGDKNTVDGKGRAILADDPLSPGKMGFDEWVSADNFFDLDPVLGRNGVPEKFHGDSSDVTTDEALKFIRKQASAGKAFLTVVWFGSPHSPHIALPADKEAYRSLPEKDQNYYGEITAIDRSVGRIRAALRDLKVSENTLIWYNSDNGGAYGPKSTGNLRGAKGSVWEGGLRVPGIVEWPARITRPFISDTPCCTVDIYPTVLAATDAVAKNQIQPLDGVSLLPVFDQKSQAQTKPYFFWKRANDQPNHIAMLQWPYKLHTNAKAEQRETGKRQGESLQTLLYDVSKDANETDNLAAQEPERVAEMTAAIEIWKASVEASLGGADYMTIAE